MFQSFAEILTKYAKDTSVAKMFVQLILIAAVTTWLAAVFVVSSNFTTVVEVWEGLQQGSTPFDLNRALVASEQVNQFVDRQRAILGVDRLYVAKFHNGKVDPNGIHFLFFSRVAEEVGYGVSRELYKNQNLPISIFPGMISVIKDRKCYFVDDVNNNVEHHTFLKEMGVRSMLVCPIRDPADKLIGLVGIEQVRGTLNNQDRDELEKVLIPISTVLSGLLTIG